MNSKQLIAALNIERQQLAAWLKQGLPCVSRNGRRVYDAEIVKEWLIQNGHAKSSTVATIAEVARYFGVSRTAVSGWFADGCPHEPQNYNLDAIATWREIKRGDPLLTGPGSPALERYREARAKIEELNLLERKKVLCRADKARESLHFLIHTIRRGMAELQRRFGTEAMLIIGEATDAADFGLKQIWGSDEFAPLNRDAVTKLYAEKEQNAQPEKN